jgi:histidine kinase/DNA gyrase B/HSP90-like ATPase
VQSVAILDLLDEDPDRLGVLRVGSEVRDNDAIVVTVQDSGPGIDGENLDKIFDAFFTTKRNGTGLGLAICRMIVERHRLSIAPTAMRQIRWKSLWITAHAGPARDAACATGLLRGLTRLADESRHGGRYGRPLALTQKNRSARNALEPARRLRGMEPRPRREQL